MFDMGFLEVALIFVLLLVVIGPERLPKLARTAGLWIGKARTMVASVKAEVEQELKVEDFKRSITQHSDIGEIKRLADQVKTINSDIRSADENIRLAASNTKASAPIAMSNPPTPVPSSSPSLSKKNNPADGSSSATDQSSSSTKTPVK